MVPGEAYGEHIGLWNASTASRWPNGPNVLIASDWLNAYWSSASSPVNPWPPGLRGSGSTARLRLSRSARTIARFWASSGVGWANLLSSATVGVAACTACLPVTEACPSERSAGRDALANPHWLAVYSEEQGARLVNSVRSCPADAFRFWRTGVLASE